MLLDPINVEGMPYLHIQLETMSERLFWQLALFTSMKHPPLHGLSLVLFENQKAVDAALVAGCSTSQITRAKKVLNDLIARLQRLKLNTFHLEQLTESDFDSLMFFLKKDKLTNKSVAGLKLVLFNKLSQTEAAESVGCRKQAISNLNIELTQRLRQLAKLAATVDNESLKTNQNYQCREF